MLGFIIGIFVGGILGIFVMCLCEAAAKADDQTQYLNEKHNEDKNNER